MFDLLFELLLRLLVLRNKIIQILGFLLVAPILIERLHVLNCCHIVLKFCYFRLVVVVEGWCIDLLWLVLIIDDLVWLIGVFICTVPRLNHVFSESAIGLLSWIVFVLYLGAVGAGEADWARQLVLENNSYRLQGRVILFLLIALVIFLLDF